VLHTGRNMKHFSREHVYDLRLIRADPKSQAAFEYVSYLFVLMRVTRDHTSFLKIDVRQHHAIAGD